ncbi:LysR family transcriptional regulator [Rahnella ecdela]|uniref:LysR family transcriptional regulator n=1 Tax=Rahnella ecdela TaxID=2816250 RepID=A0ABS6LAE9_9GAMM|nr:LysR family transcriptional regulator [Rahnella ecdela]MBU9843903.1 LysR family transcriptional regulator [Rahnella ecdela]
MNNINIKKLQIVNALIECGNACGAAKKLFISPSTISYTLNQLHTQLGESLFRREKGGLKPNKEAFVLQEKYHEIMGLSIPRKAFIITTYSLIELLLADYIHDLISDRYLHFTPMDVCEDERLRKLKHREVDIDIGGKLPVDASIISKRYLYSRMCILVNKDHTLIKNNFCLSDWRENKHLRWQRDIGSITSMVGGIKITDPLFSEREISWESSNLLTLAYICSCSDNIMIVPEVFTKPLMSMLPLKTFMLPTELEMKFTCYLHYHRSLQHKVSSLGLYNIFNN